MDDSTMAAFLEAFTNQPDNTDINEYSNSWQSDRRSSLASSYSGVLAESSPARSVPSSVNLGLGHSAAPALSAGTSSQSGRSPSTGHSGFTSPHSQDYVSDIFTANKMGGDIYDGDFEYGQFGSSAGVNAMKPQYLFAGGYQQDLRPWTTRAEAAPLPQSQPMYSQLAPSMGQAPARGQETHIGASAQVDPAALQYMRALAFAQGQAQLQASASSGQANQLRADVPYPQTEPSLLPALPGDPSLSDRSFRAYPDFDPFLPSGGYALPTMPSHPQLNASNGQGQDGQDQGDLSVRLSSASVVPMAMSKRVPPRKPSTAAPRKARTKHYGGSTMDVKAPGVSSAKAAHQTSSTDNSSSGIDKLHNKVEQRYRSNVKDALEMLRDSVPRLRAIFGTSTAEQQRTTDREDENGMIGGVEKVHKPTKQTVMVVARLYIEHLERSQVVLGDRLLRAEAKLRELSPSQAAFNAWRYEEESRSKGMESALRQAADALEAIRGEAEDSGGPEDGQEDAMEHARPRKRSRVGTVKENVGDTLPRAMSTSQAHSKTPVTAAAGVGTVIMSSFGLAYTFFPRASSFLPHEHDGGLPSSSTVFSGRVLMSTPAAMADRSHALLARALPASRLPRPDDLLDWSLLVVLASGVAFAVWYVIKQLEAREHVFGQKTIMQSTGNRMSQRDVAISRGAAGLTELKRLSGCANPTSMLSDWLRGSGKFEGDEDRHDNPDIASWLRLIELDIGSVHKLSRLERLHAKMAKLPSRLHSSASGTALLALWIEDPRESAQLWARARALVSQASGQADKHLAAALSISLTDAKAVLSNIIDPSTDPVATIGNHAILLHLVDLAEAVLASMVDQIKYSDDQRRSLKFDVCAAQRGLGSVSGQIQKALRDAAAGSEARALGMALITLVISLSGGLDKAKHRELASALIRADLAWSGAMPALAMAARLLVPDYSQTPACGPGISLDARKLDDMLCACFKLVLAVGQPAHALDALAGHSGEVLEDISLDIRALLARNAPGMGARALTPEMLDRLTEMLTCIGRPKRPIPNPDEMYDSGIGSDSDDCAGR